MKTFTKINRIFSIFIVRTYSRNVNIQSQHTGVQKTLSKISPENALTPPRSSQLKMQLKRSKRALLLLHSPSLWRGRPSGPGELDPTLRSRGDAPARLTSRTPGVVPTEHSDARLDAKCWKGVGDPALYPALRRHHSGTQHVPVASRKDLVLCKRDTKTFRRGDADQIWISPKRFGNLLPLRMLQRDVTSENNLTSVLFVSGIEIH